MPTRNQPTLNRRGNPIANNALMRKGGAHVKSRSSKRQKQRRETRQLVTKYMSGYGRKRSNKGTHGGGVKSPSCGSSVVRQFFHTFLYRHLPLHQMKNAA